MHGPASHRRRSAALLCKESNSYLAELQPQRDSPSGELAVA